jgi:drug/metabolite transporter (DMT)-like permease
MTDLGFPVLCAIGAGLANTVVAVTVKGAQKNDCRPAKFGIVSMAAAFAISLLVSQTQSGSWLDWRLWALGVILGFLWYAAILLMVQANRLGPPSLPWAMANLALVVPVALAAVFFNESLRGKDAISLLVFGGMLLAFVQGTSRAGDVDVGNRRGLVLFLLLVFLANGLLMFGFKLNSFLPAGVNKSALSAIMYGTGALLAVLDEIRKPYRKFLFKELTWGAAMGIGNGSSLLLLLVAMKLPANVAFPIIQGVSFLGGIGFTGLIFRERVNRWKILGIFLGLAVILLSVFR